MGNLQERALIVNAAGDHVRPPVWFPPAFVIAGAWRLRKPNSPRRVHGSRGRSTLARQAGYGGSSVSQ
jgi:hypothetical protein